jgi:thioredoxin 1
MALLVRASRQQRALLLQGWGACRGGLGFSTDASGEAAARREGWRRSATRTPLGSLPRPPPTGAPGGTVRELSTPDDFDAALASGAPALLDFSAVWCAPCKAVAPVLAALAAENRGVAFYTVDIDNAALADRVADHAVAAVPTFVGYHKGARVGHFSGADRAQLAALVAKLAKPDGS